MEQRSWKYRKRRKLETQQSDTMPVIHTDKWTRYLSQAAFEGWLYGMYGNNWQMKQIKSLYFSLLCVWSLQFFRLHRSRNSKVCVNLKKLVTSRQGQIWRVQRAIQMKTHCFSCVWGHWLWHYSLKRNKSSVLGTLLLQHLMWLQECFKKTPRLKWNQRS